MAKIPCQYDDGEKVEEFTISSITINTAFGALYRGVASETINIGAGREKVRIEFTSLNGVSAMSCTTYNPNTGAITLMLIRPDNTQICNGKLTVSYF